MVGRFYQNPSSAIGKAADPSFRAGDATLVRCLRHGIPRSSIRSSADMRRHERKPARKSASHRVGTSHGENSQDSAGQTPRQCGWSPAPCSVQNFTPQIFKTTPKQDSVLILMASTRHRRRGRGEAAAPTLRAGISESDMTQLVPDCG